SARPRKKVPAPPPPRARTPREQHASRFGRGRPTPVPRTMLLRLRTAAASMAMMIRRQERTANNLANADTVGFRRERTFATVLENALDAEGAPRTTRRMGGWADLSAGALEQTGNPLDLALE